MSQGDRFSPYGEDFDRQDKALSGFDFQNNILNKVFWFTRAKLKVGRVPFVSRRMIEDLTRVIPSDFYGQSFEGAKFSTRANFDTAFNNPKLLADLDAHKIDGEMRSAYSLLSHGYNSSAILGKIRNTEIKQAVYRIKLHSRAADIDTPFMDAWARISDQEPNVSVDQFIAVLRAERNIKHPENFNEGTRPAVADKSLGYYTPSLENGLPLRSFTGSFDRNDALFESVMRDISDKVGIDFVPVSEVAKGEPVSEKYIGLKPKRFFGALDVIKKRVSPLKYGISPTGWPKRYKMEYPEQNTNTEKLYGVIKCLCGLQADQLGNIAERVILANQAATNLPSPQVFNEARGRLTSAAACLIASDVCYMLNLPVEQARLMSDTFKLEAEQNLSMLDTKGNKATHFMPMIANMYAIGVHNFAYDLNPSMQSYAEAKGISLDEVAYKMDGNPSMQGLIYANNVITDPALRLEPDMNSEAVAQALERIFENGRQPSEEKEEDREAERERTVPSGSSTPSMDDVFARMRRGTTRKPAPVAPSFEEPTPTPTPVPTPKPETPTWMGTERVSDETARRLFGNVFEQLGQEDGLPHGQRVEREIKGWTDPAPTPTPSPEPTPAPEPGKNTDSTDDTKSGETKKPIPSLEDLVDRTPSLGFEQGQNITPEEIERRRRELLMNDHPVDRPDLRIFPENRPDLRQEDELQPEEMRLRAGSDEIIRPVQPQQGKAVTDLTEEQKAIMERVFARMNKSRGMAQPTPSQGDNANAENENAKQQTGFREAPDKQETQNGAGTEAQGQNPAGNATQAGMSGGINININNHNYFNTINHYIITDCVNIYYQNYAYKGTYAGADKNSQQNSGNARVEQATLERYALVSQRQSQGQKTLDDYANGDKAEQAKAQGNELPDVIYLPGHSSTHNKKELAEEAKTFISKGEEFSGTESCAEVIEEIQKAKKTAPVLKNVDFEYSAARFASETAMFKRQTQAKTKCREVLFDLVMEYSSDRMAQTAECAKLIDGCEDEARKCALEAERKYYKERASIGAVATVVMYPSSQGRTQTNSSYNAQSFPEETRAVEQIDRLSGYIMCLVKEFCEVNREHYGDKKLAITASKLTQMLETSGATQFEGKSTRAERIEAGRDMLKESLRDTVYAILDGVTLPPESSEVLELRQTALTSAAVEGAIANSSAKGMQFSNTSTSSQHNLDEYVYTQNADSDKSNGHEQEKF